MYTNKLYNTRSGGRFSAPNQFVSAGEQKPLVGAQNNFPQPNPQQVQPNQPLLPQLNMSSNLQEIPLVNMDIKSEMNAESEDHNMEESANKNEERPAWMKSKLGGVKKISNKERRRRQNETLRRLLTPKNALMVLNEMMPNEQVTNQFKVEPAQSQFYARNAHSFCADLTLEGSNYKGYGENKLSARNSAAEQAIRDLIIKKMNKAMVAEATSTESQNGDEPMDEESLPMIQLASFALHKLFTEWECDGHKVPQLRPSSSAASESVPAPSPPPPPPAAAEPRRRARRGTKARVVPDNAALMHPCMLLTYMRPSLDYRELAAEGDKPQNMTFTMGVEIDGVVYSGKASNKKEARKAAAREACAALFGVKFVEGAAAVTPIHATAPA